MPNMVDLTVSTPVKDEPEVKTEQVSLSNTARSLPLDESSTQPQGLQLAILDDTQDTSSVSCSVTLGTETRSLDTTDPPTPVRSPPAKMRRSTRQSSRRL